MNSPPLPFRQASAPVLGKGRTSRTPDSEIAAKIASRAAGRLHRLNRMIPMADLPESPANDYLLIDLRGLGRYRAGHIPAAVRIPPRQLRRLTADCAAQAPLLLYCQTGARAKRIASLLRVFNIAKVYVIEGGFAAWKTAGRPVASAPEQI